MKLLPINEELKSLARQLVWFEPPEDALAWPARFLAYAFAYATHEQMNVLRRYLGEEDFRAALAEAPPGIIDARSWAYWNRKFGRTPVPPMPQRRFA